MIDGAAPGMSPTLRVADVSKGYPGVLHGNCVCAHQADSMKWRDACLDHVVKSRAAGVQWRQAFDGLGPAAMGWLRSSLPCLPRSGSPVGHPSGLDCRGRPEVAAILDVNARPACR
jgi:hypothetical protein